MNDNDIDVEKNPLVKPEFQRSSKSGM